MMARITKRPIHPEARFWFGKSLAAHLLARLDSHVATRFARSLGTRREVCHRHDNHAFPVCGRPTLRCDFRTMPSKVRPGLGPAMPSVGSDPVASRLLNLEEMRVMWTKDTLQELIQTKLSERQLILVS